MTFTEAQITENIASIWFPFLRIDAAVMAAPLFGSNLVPGRVRILLGLAIALVVVPMLPKAPPVELLSIAGLLLSINEILIGVCLGWLLQWVFDAAVIAGQTIAMGMGLGFATMVDPLRGVAVPVLSQFLLLMCWLLFLSMNGHLAFFELVRASFDIWPVGGRALSPEALQEVIQGSAVIFDAGLRIALPAVLALLLVQLGMGVVSRTAPALNLFAVGFPLALMIGFIVIAEALPTLLPVLESVLIDTKQRSLDFLVIGNG